MTRKNLIDSRDLPYHLTARANNKENFPGDLDFIWKTLTNELYLQTILHRIRIHAFVLMPNHFHLLATTPHVSIDRPMKEFLSSSTRIINTRYVRWGRIFGGKYHRSLIADPLYYAHALKYVYRNPVKAGLCDTVGEYRFSTFALQTGLGSIPVPLQSPLNEMNRLVPCSADSHETLEDWLNLPHRNEENLAIRKALKKKTFEIAVNRENRKKVILDGPI